MPLIKVFGRITSASKTDITEILESVLDPTQILACYETADDGCTNFHSHFIAQSASYRTLKSLRNTLSTKCYKILGAHNQYSVKEYKPDNNAEPYICKGHKKDTTIKPDIFINTLGINVNENYELFHENQKTFKETQNVRNTWKSIVQYINEKEPMLLHTEFNTKTQYKICSLMYDYYIDNDKIIQGKYQQQNILRTIIAHSFKCKKIKKQIILDWSEDFQYYRTDTQNHEINHTINCITNEDDYL